MIGAGLTDKVVFITGTNTLIGIGAAVARVFAGQGGRSFLHDFRPPQTAVVPPVSGSPFRPSARSCLSLQTFSPSLLLDEVRSASALVCAIDLSNPGTISSLFDVAKERLGAVDILADKIPLPEKGRRSCLKRKRSRTPYWH